ncbi:hypothetical protein IE077_002971 [Cardiosporidium cionae]|uniref:Transmembrane protein n=1 Tax=Cardiosporidium cionae TaxID=476202 RepID=A0ABQ7J9K1_9APIC|nr:hypothetical protein IE077_002971 [Cardiosporidium cionae]|eukprot:KAF8820647.1 hypothetical protein IE077_002971 [Cardiosporidium cionae]
MEFFSRIERPRSVQNISLLQKPFYSDQDPVVSRISPEFRHSLLSTIWFFPSILLVIALEVVICALLSSPAKAVLFPSLRSPFYPTYSTSLGLKPGFLFKDKVSSINDKKSVSQRSPSALPDAHTAVREPANDFRIFTWIGWSDSSRSSASSMFSTESLLKQIRNNASIEIRSSAEDPIGSTSLLNLHRLADEKNISTQVLLTFSIPSFSSASNEQLKTNAANYLPFSLSRRGEDVEFARSLNNAIAVSDAVFVPISYLDILNGNWLNSLSYKALLFVLSFHMRCAIRNIAALTLKQRLHYLSKNDSFALSGAYSQPKKICFTIITPSRKEDTTSSFAVSDQERKEITILVKQTVSRILNDNFRAMSSIENVNDSYFRRIENIFDIQVLFLNQSSNRNKINALLERVCNDVDTQNPRRTLNNAIKIVKRFDSLIQTFLASNELPRMASREHLRNIADLEDLEKLEKTKLSIFKRCRSTMAAYPSSFHFGLDAEFGASCDEIIDNALAAFDEETRRLQGSTHWHKKRQELLRFLLMDLHPKFDLQVQKLRMLSLDQFRSAINELPLDANVAKSLSVLIRNANQFFATNCRKLKAKTADITEWNEGFARSDLQFSMREIANTILEFARMNGVYDLGKKLRKPVSVSLHYLSPNAFGLSDYSRRLLTDPDKLSYDQKAGVLLSSVDPRLNKQDNVLIPYDVPIDLKLLSDSMVYTPDKK